MATRVTMPEAQALAAARDGNEHAFAGLVEPYQRELHAHCYRMLGSAHDADDAMQDVLLRAWKALKRFEGRSSLRSWLYTIATNSCLNQIQRRPKRVLPIDYGPPTSPDDGPGRPLVESVWIEPYPDELLGAAGAETAPEARYELRESVELAFVAALQHLPANQRAALILREVLGFSAKEVADALDTSVPSVNSALQRARKTIDDKLPEQSQQATLRALGDDEVRKVVEQYMAAMDANDVDTVVTMLADDAAWSMPPLASWFRGDEIPDFLARYPLSGEYRWKRVATSVNGQPTIAAYTWREDEGCFRPFALDVLTFEGGRIKEVCAFIVRSAEEEDPEKIVYYPHQEIPEEKVASVFGRAGLPDRID